MNRKHIIHNILMLLCMAALTVAASCADDLFTDTGKPFGEGESTVKLNIEYRPMTGAQLGGTRATDGDAIKTIDNVFIAWYDEEGRLAGSKFLNRNEMTVTTENRDTLDVLETQTEHAELTCLMPYGRYRIYAVANMGDLTGQVDTESMLRSRRLTWNSSDITANSQMSGYFSTSKETAYAKGEAPLVDINKTSISLHSWVRRAASKVTIAFDAHKLNENIYVYIQSAQIKDIPYNCALIDANTPAKGDSLIADGDMIIYGQGTDHTKWPKVSCGRGANYMGDHANNAPSLFFYENMQGKHADKHKYNNFDKKDDMLYGTYIEVKGYYVNNSATNPSEGAITYRCMLGKNMTDDFNAERNCHYRLTLMFNNDANDPDWHIVYDYEPAPPELVVPNPLYISYLSNKSLNIPVTIYYDKKVTSVTSIKAEIIQNDWGYYDHPYDPDYVQNNNPTLYDKYKSDFENLRKLYNGFLSLEYNSSTAISDREADFKNKKEKTFTTPTEKNDSVYHFNVPVYTRPMNLGGSFSGNNYYISRRRYAKVVITANLTSGGPLHDTIDVIQVRRMVNPKGIWRKGTSTKEFRVNLKYSEGDKPTLADNFRDVESDGPWTARIIKGADWVRIKDTESNTWGTADVTGGTGSVVEFDYKPATEYTDGCRFGLIEVLFHNNTCPHIILVSQGIGPVDIGGNKWHMTNVLYDGTDAANPLIEGSMFKFGNSATALMSKNNEEAGYGFRESAFDKSFDVYTDSKGNTGQAVFKDIPASTAGFTNKTITDNGASRVATAADWKALMDVNKFTRYYGVLYGDECTNTLSDPAEVNKYMKEGDIKGMRGCFVCDNETGTHLFFPIGTTGHGRRQYLDYESLNTKVTTEIWGALKYANRTGEMPEETAVKLPCYYELSNELGAVYWYGVRDTESKFYGFDINYLTFGFEAYTTERVWSTQALFEKSLEKKPLHIAMPTLGVFPNSDACLMRRIYTK